MLIGLGGGAASSVGSGASSADLDFASVQRGNPEIERRAQQVIEACRASGALAGRAESHPHGPRRRCGRAVERRAGAGATTASAAARFELREIPSAEPGMSPLEIWCNEAQERYVLAIDPVDLDWFAAVCERERCPFAVLGTLDDSGRLRRDRPPAPASARRHAAGDPARQAAADGPARSPAHAVAAPARPGRHRLEDACLRVLRLPAVADKSFLIHIGDRTVGGLVARDQLVGPWQVPVSDVGVTALGFDTFAGEAMAMGERTPVALLDAPASGRLAVGEALTNIAAASIARPRRWCGCRQTGWPPPGVPGEDERLYDTVRGGQRPVPRAAASRSRSARIRCRCRPAGRRRRPHARSWRRCR